MAGNGHAPPRLAGAEPQELAAILGLVGTVAVVDQHVGGHRPGKATRLDRLASAAQQSKGAFAKAGQAGRHPLSALVLSRNRATAVRALVTGLMRPARHRRPPGPPRASPPRPARWRRRHLPRQSPRRSRQTGCHPRWMRASTLRRRSWSCRSLKVIPKAGSRPRSGGGAHRAVQGGPTQIVERKGRVEKELAEIHLIILVVAICHGPRRFQRGRSSTSVPS